MKKIKIYVACSVTFAPKEYLEKIAKLKNMLRENENIQLLDFMEAEVSGSNIYVYCRSMVNDAHLILAIHDFPSEGLGSEVTIAYDKKTPVIACSHVNSTVSDFTTERVKHFGDIFYLYNDIFHMVDIVQSRVAEMLEHEGQAL